MTEWIACKDRLPEVEPEMGWSREILVYAPSSGGESGSMYLASLGDRILRLGDRVLRWMTSEGGEWFDLAEVSHWMPLPDPPDPPGGPPDDCEPVPPTMKVARGTWTVELDTEGVADG